MRVSSSLQASPAMLLSFLLLLGVASSSSSSRTTSTAFVSRSSSKQSLRNKIGSSSSVVEHLPTKTQPLIALQSSSSSDNTNNNNANEPSKFYNHLDRAHMEETLDHAMGDDWRLFRAKLVAQEDREKQEIQRIEREQATKLITTPKRIISRILEVLKEFFMKFLFFMKSNKDDDDGGVTTDNGARTNIMSVVNDASDEALFAAVSDATASVSSLSDDPFASAAELPIFFPPAPKIDTQYWAHPLSHIEVGCVLVATDRVRPTSPFHQSVILILKHSDSEEQTVGIMLNKPTQKTLLQVPPPPNQQRQQPQANNEMDTDKSQQPPFGAPQRDTITPQPYNPMEYQQPSNHLHNTPPGALSNLDRTTQVAFWYAPVYNGGPDDSEQYTTMHGFGNVEGSTRVVPGVYCGGSQAFLEGGLTPPMVFVKGRTVWNTKRQLQREIKKKQWIIAAASPEFLLEGTASIADSYSNMMLDPAKGRRSGSNNNISNEDVWADVLTCLGGQYTKMVKKHNDRKAQQQQQQQRQSPQPPEEPKLMP